MKQKIIIFLMLTTILSHEAIAQTKEEKEVSAAVETLRAAMISADSTALTQILSDKLGYGHSGGKVQTKNELIHSLTSGESDFVTIELSDQTVGIFDHTAIIRHVLSATTNDNGKPGSVKLSILLVWQKQHGAWKLIARQAVRMPQP
jgi:ketosteroid isomerase-like protein